jgi:hypothetical protein
MNFVLAILIVILPSGSSFEPQKKCFDVAKVQLCEKFLRDEVDECLVYIKPFYNKVSLSADWITIFATYLLLRNKCQVRYD